MGGGFGTEPRRVPSGCAGRPGASPPHPRPLVLGHPTRRFDPLRMAGWVPVAASPSEGHAGGIRPRRATNEIKELQSNFAAIFLIPRKLGSCKPCHMRTMKRT